MGEGVSVCEGRRLFSYYRMAVLCICCALVLALKLYIFDTSSFLLTDHVTFPAEPRRTSLLAVRPGSLLRYIPKSYTSGYIVYTCTSDNICGGWSDRLSGILSTFVISLLTKQRFLIRHNYPCFLQEFLEPIEYDWIYNDSISNHGNTTHYNLLNKESVKVKKYLYGKKDLKKYFNSSVNFIHMNWDFTEVFRARPHIGSDVPWITKRHYADIYKDLFNYLFKPSETVTRALKSIKRKRRKTACAHIRIGKSPDLPKDPPRHREPLNILWKLFDNLEKDVYDIFIATDDDRVRRKASKRYPTQIIGDNGKIGHIDRGLLKGNKYKVFLKMIMDFYTLINCDVLVLTESGFGIMAAYVRNTDSDLYCWRGSELKPCSRYTVHHMFDWPILAPPEHFPLMGRPT